MGLTNGLQSINGNININQQTSFQFSGQSGIQPESIISLKVKYFSTFHFRYSIKKTNFARY